MTNDQPLVSVVIPTYNQADLLAEAIKSVVDQTYPNWELIVVNNFSDDHTATVVESVAHARCQLINFRNNGVIAAARNKGIELARGDYIALLDSDDKWDSTKLEVCMRRLLQSQADLTCHGLRFMQRGVLWREVAPGPLKQTQYRNMLYDGSCLTTSAVVVRKQVLQAAGGFCEDRRYITAEDYELWLRLARSGIKFDVFPAMLGEYRLHAGNSSKAALKHCEANISIVLDNFQAIGEVGLWERIRQQNRIAMAHYSCGRSFQRSGLLPEARASFSKSIRMFPFMVRPYVAWVLTLFNG